MYHMVYLLQQQLNSNEICHYITDRIPSVSWGSPPKTQKTRETKVLDNEKDFIVMICN